MALFALFTTAPSVPIDWNSTSKLINCASLENKSNTIQRRVFVWFIFLDILSLASFGFLKMFQKFEMSNPVLKYSVHKRVAVKELVRTVQIIVPNLIFNVFCYLYFASVSILNTTGENVDPIRFLMANSVPFYICLSPLIWIFAIRRLDAKLDVRKNVNTFENHFNSLNDFWNGELEKGEEPPGPRIQRKMSHPERLFDNISSCNSVHPAPGSVV
uniref:Uncharacterized protein n=1 Tax=Caenorhabditis japonica TaxID=281687 RepID=A0A8R1HV36_CAEJA